MSDEVSLDRAEISHEVRSPVWPSCYRLGQPSVVPTSSRWRVRCLHGLQGVGGWKRICEHESALVVGSGVAVDAAGEILSSQIGWDRNSDH